MITYITNTASLPSSVTGQLPDGGNGYAPAWDCWVSSFLTYLEGRNRSADTRRTYAKALSRLKRWMDGRGMPVAALSPESLVEYRRGLSALSVSSMNVNIAALRRFFGWLLDEGYVRMDIARGLEGQRRSAQFVKTPLTIEQQRDLLSHMRSRTDSSGIVRMRDYAMVNLLLLCGLRSVEVARATTTDITEKYGQRVLMVWGKGHDRPDDPVVLTDDAWTPLQAYLDGRGWDGRSPEPLFQCHGRGSSGYPMSTRRIQDVVKTALRAIGLDAHEYSTHSLRHTCGTTLLSLGASVSDVQHVLRHRDEKTTMIYVGRKREELMIRNSPQHLLDRLFKDEEEDKEKV